MRIICCVTNDIVTDQRVNRICRTLQKQGASIIIAGIQRISSLPLENSGMSYRRFKMLFGKGPLFYLEYNTRLFFFLLSHAVDILVSNDLDTLPAVYLASVIKKRPVVYDSHEYFTELPELVGRHMIRQIWIRIENLILPKLKYSCTVNDSIAAEYSRRYGIAMMVIRNLPLRVEKIPDDHSLKTSDEKLILYQGALNIGRGLELAIESMKYLNNCRLIIAGSGYHERELKQLVKSHATENKVQFLGSVRPQTLIKYTAQADLGISLEENRGLNYYFALPNKLFDYIQARIPVLVSDLPEMSAIVRKFNIGKVSNAANAEELSDVISKMLYDSNLIKIWKQNLERAAAELCWENEEMKVLDLYDKVIKDHASLIKGK